jgi:hypothetical protein
VCLFTVHVGSRFSPLSCGVFLLPPLSQAFLLLVAGHGPPLLPSVARPGQFCEGFPSPTSALSAPHPLCYMSLLFLLLITQFLFFSLGGGWSVQGAMLIWPRIVCGSTTHHLAHLVVRVFPAVWARASGGSPGALLVSPFNVKWRCSVQAGGVEGSKFCLFSVALPVRCISSVSPRFHFRRHTFCFLPLATILESPPFAFCTP